MKLDSSYEGFSSNVIVKCSVTIKRLGNIGLESKNVPSILHRKNEWMNEVASCISTPQQYSSFFSCKKKTKMELNSTYLQSIVTQSGFDKESLKVFTSFVLFLYNHMIYLIGIPQVIFNVMVCSVIFYSSQVNLTKNYYLS